ncbi:hypothetical protein EUGRSUZ_C02235 [Eucalyptus grandis]|uniref:Uncharacterized protein n=2 Tax=Eucalyptus grandis TaxID=71139 RepID=A0ACC3LF53_EUCGR|nr:hypothetical protein EUGRSUZ_C02235 [Eucalyptus grandis]
MARLLQAYCLVLLFVLTAGLMVKTTGAKVCTEGLGTCAGGNDCEQSCFERHGPGSQGTCDRTISPPLCSCIFMCPLST